MQIVFGLELDSTTYCGNPDNNRQTLFLGTSRFLTFLEKQLACSITETNQYLRLAQFREAILTYLKVDPNAFFSDSFQSDSWTTSEELLARRDELVIGGWKGNVSGECPPRIVAFARIEQILSEREQPFLKGVADRWTSIFKALQHQTLYVDSISVNEPKHLLPPPFSRLFALIENQGVGIEYGREYSPEGSTDLSVFKSWLNGTNREAQRTVKADGSILILTCKRENFAAAYLAQFFRKNKFVRPVCLIPEKNYVLDNALIHEGLPAMGIESASFSRPSLQLMKLIPVFLWEPVNPYKVLEFLSLRNKPLNNSLAYGIAKILARTPGIDGEDWQAYLTKFFEGEEAEALHAKQNIKPKQVLKEFRFLFERKRYSEDKEVPVKVVSQLFSYLKDWSLSEYDKSKVPQTTLLVLAQLSERFLEVIEALPASEKSINKLYLERLINTVYESAALRFREAEKGHLPFVHHQSAIVDSAEELLWWNFTKIEDNRRFAKWYRKEVEWFDANSVSVFQSEQKNQLDLWKRKQPILRTNKRLFLIVPELIEGKQSQEHPLLGDLEACFGDISMLKRNIDNPDTIIDEAFNTVSWKALENMKVAEPPPYLEITSKDELEEREKESYSSLEALFYYPHKWMFRYKLGWRNSALLSVVRERTMLGNLAHKLFNDMFKTSAMTWSREQLDEWLSEYIPTLLEKEGCVLLLYGRAPEKEAFFQTLRQSAWKLISMLKENGWFVKGSELELEGTFASTDVYGFADLVLENKAGEVAILDLKWSGSTYRKNLIRNEEDLQLVLYAKLAAKEHSWAHAAYYIIESGEIVARNNKAFKEAFCPEKDANHLTVNSNIWKRMENTYYWRLKQLKDGKLEVRTENNLSLLESPTTEIKELTNFLELPMEAAKFDDYEAIIRM